MRSLGVAPAVALTLLLAACGGSVATPSAGPTDPAPSVDLSPSGTPPPSEPGPTASPEMSWQRIELPADQDIGAVVDVEATADGFVALGFSGPTGSTIWTSTDGRTWTERPQPQWENVALPSMAEVDGRLIAVGRDTTDIEAEFAVVWISENGVEWRLAEGGPDLVGAQLIEVVPTNTGLVAIGGFPGRDAAAAFTSADGEFWTLAGTETPDAFDQAFAWSVAAGGPGLVAVGWRRNADSAIGFDPAFWTSTDGTSWSLGPTPDGAPGAQARDVVALEDGTLAAVGDLVNGGRSFAWASEDGIGWELVEEGEGFDGGVVSDLSPVVDGLLAAGSVGVDGALWTTGDGRTWTAVRDPVLDDAYLVETLAADGGLIAVGALQRQIPGTESFTTAPAIWYAEPHP